jgi:hypothetical protein
MSIGGTESGGAVRELLVDADGHLQADVISSALPSGAATSALQTAANADLAAIEVLQGSIDGKITACNTGAVVLAPGSNAIGKLATNSGVDIGDVDVTSIIPGTAATNLGKAIQSQQASTDTGVAALVVRNDTLSDLAGADGDYSALQVNASGALYVCAPTITTGTITSSSGIAVNATTTLPADGTNGLDLRAKNGKVTLFGSIDGTTDNNSGYNNIQLMGSISSISDNSTFTDLGPAYEIVVGTGGVFATTIDIVIPYIKFKVVNAESTARTLVVKSAFN